MAKESKMTNAPYRYRKYEELPISTKPLIVGWIASKAHVDLMREGREKELPGYWLYRLQLKFPGRRGRLCGWLFGIIYAGGRVKRCGDG